MAALMWKGKTARFHRTNLLKLCSDVFSFQSTKFFGTKVNHPEFGLLFDIDGVIVRGKKVLPSVPESFQKLVDKNGMFRVPTVFVTNAGNALRHDRAIQLSNWLGVEVHEDQVVMAHSPLRMFHQFHDKRVLVSGQGPVADIARNVGFHNIVTVDELRKTFPTLDAVDHARRISGAGPNEKSFVPVDAVVLFGEPVRWETSLQLILDILMSNGYPAVAPPGIMYPHIPVLACNMDLQWMAEACMPRFGHGAFLLCLEALYKKITGKELIYTALIGKPSEITYHHAHHMVLNQAQSIGINHHLKRLYAIGDNINTDVFGANLYNQYLSQRKASGRVKQIARTQTIEHHLQADPSDWDNGAENCFSILVETGVYSVDREESLLDHTPRDFLPVEEKLREPNFTVPNVCKAIDLVFEQESYQ
ncbi:Haloacid dehalogenase-like hydrolase domain-containing 5 [Frankliniella fusca]|uniref:Haloacid dehalogenase-like hydrolase domain-containing 5 n=1 Tax=Frankliniella fusca TaxID=407009 RepID=A0AAE1I1D4_9NEOP|nr:Haloacid dehalogenase-like hydrolase domain-containing 5 [Frankliniella fusca]